MMGQRSLDYFPQHWWDHIMCLYLLVWSKLGTERLAIQLPFSNGRQDLSKKLLTASSYSHLPSHPLVG
jgi:hypothetical protein